MEILFIRLRFHLRLGGEAGRETKLNRITPQNNGPPEMTATVCPDPTEREEYVRWLRANTEIEGFASLCDDVCSMVARHCEEGRWAIQYWTTNKICLLTAPLDCVSTQDTRVRRDEWDKKWMCDLYMDSVGLKLRGPFSIIGCDFLPDKLKTSVINTSARPYEVRFGENGEYHCRDNELFLPNGKIIKGGYSYDIKHGRILIVRSGNKIYGYDDESAELKFTIQRSVTGVDFYRYQHFMVDQNTSARFLGNEVTIYDIRSATFSPFHLPHANADLRDMNAARCGTILTKTRHRPGMDGSQISLESYKFDLRGGWVPHYNIKVPNALAVMGYRGYRE